MTLHGHRTHARPFDHQDGAAFLKKRGHLLALQAANFVLTLSDHKYGSPRALGERLDVVYIAVADDPGDTFGDGCLSDATQAGGGHGFDHKSVGAIFGTRL